MLHLARLAGSTDSKGGREQPKQGSTGSRHLLAEAHVPTDDRLLASSNPLDKSRPWLRIRTVEGDCSSFTSCQLHHFINFNCSCLNLSNLINFASMAANVAYFAILASRKGYKRV